jgi:RimJ/RimL family protein N-acetyltransferase
MEAMSESGVFEVRELDPADIDVRIDYFHGASDDHLGRLGVDRALLPDRAAWRASYAADHARPLRERETYVVRWDLGGILVGFSSMTHIEYGDQGFLHLHVLDPERRGIGLGRSFVRESADLYIDRFELRRVLSEPNAFNVAPNRALQAAGFRYQYTHETVPGPWNLHQPVTRWLYEPSRS